MERIKEAAAGGSPSPGPSTGHENESVTELISGMVGDVQGLVRGEIQLARTELSESASGAAKGIGMLVAGAIVALIGFVFLMLALVEVLDDAMPRWAAALIVGGGLVIIAAILALVGKSQLSADKLKPTQTIDSLQEDKEWAQQQARSVKN